MKFSIVVPIYNVEKEIKYCLESIERQEYKDFEVIMINDGSTDNSAVIAKKFEKKDLRFKLYTTKNQGLSAARNEGLKYVKGDIVYFIDSDDQISPNLLSDIAKLFVKYPDIDIIHFSHSEVRKSIRDLKKSYLEKVKLVPKHQVISMLINGQMMSTAWSNICKTKVIKQNHLRFSNGRLFEDENYNLKLFSCVDKVLFLTFNEGPYFYLIGRPESIYNKALFKTNKKHFDDRCFILNDEYSFLKEKKLFPFNYIQNWYLLHLIWIYNNFYFRIRKNHSEEFKALRSKIHKLYRSNSYNLNFRQKVQYYRVFCPALSYVLMLIRKIKNKHLASQVKD